MSFAVIGPVDHRQLASLTFAAHYLPFASAIPPVVSAEPPAGVQLFAKTLKWLAPAQWESLARSSGPSEKRDMPKRFAHRHRWPGL